MLFNWDDILIINVLTNIGQEILTYQTLEMVFELVNRIWTGCATTGVYGLVKRESQMWLQQSKVCYFKMK